MPFKIVCGPRELLANCVQPFWMLSKSRAQCVAMSRLKPASNSAPLKTWSMRLKTTPVALRSVKQVFQASLIRSVIAEALSHSVT